MQSITTSIGRNVGSEPMDQKRWGVFRDDLHRIIEDTVGPIVFHGTGTGIYEEMTEDSFTVVADASELTPAGSISLAAQLAALAAGYGQEFIAVTLGDTVFVGSGVTVAAMAG